MSDESASSDSALRRFLSGVRVAYGGILALLSVAAFGALVVALTFVPPAFAARHLYDVVGLEKDLVNLAMLAAWLFLVVIPGAFGLVSVLDGIGGDGR